MIVLGIESSCDETAVAVFTTESNSFYERLARQHETHKPYGGVVPELAGRRHIESLSPLIHAVCKDADCSIHKIDLVAATNGPGLAGGLLVGLTYAKALAYSIDSPFVAVNHIDAHMYAACAENVVPFPFLSLVVSGGHTLLAVVENETTYSVIGRTKDDAAGEAFDKGAKILGLGYPGGKALQDAAEKGDPKTYNFPRAMLHDPSFDMSFSGVKTALLYFTRDNPNAPLANLAASYQEAIVDVLVTKTIRAAHYFGISTIVLGGGVSANTRLRSRMNEEGIADNIRIVLPDFCFCTDNARMIAFRGKMTYTANGASPLDTDIFPRYSAPQKITRSNRIVI